MALLVATDAAPPAGCAQAEQDPRLSAWLGHHLLHQTGLASALCLSFLVCVPQNGLARKYPDFKTNIANTRFFPQRDPEEYFTKIKDR